MSKFGGEKKLEEEEGRKETEEMNSFPLSCLEFFFFTFLFRSRKNNTSPPLLLATFLRFLCLLPI